MLGHLGRGRPLFGPDRSLSRHPYHLRLTSSILPVYHTDISFRKQQLSPARREESEVAAMDSFTGKLAVVTGGGSGMGRELVSQLATAGCSVAACDLNPDTVAETAVSAQAEAGSGVLVTGHACDVADEAQLLRFRDELLEAHARHHVNLVFANAGVGGGGSFVDGDRVEWERTFAIDWQGVYYTARVFVSLLVASGEGILVNTSSVNGLWATLGPGMPNTAYSAAKFAVRGFTEALIEDLRVHAPHVRVALVLPGHVGTGIMVNTRRVHGQPGPEDVGPAELAEARAVLGASGLVPEGASDQELRQLLTQMDNDFKDKAPVTAAQAATTILDGVRSGAWRILIGQDAAWLDRLVRARPEVAYDYEEFFNEAAVAEYTSAAQAT
jgi:NAD(P)-dependent dehydrogenase (short-subunit alcohol dehydrogenase family)